jgi:hypothetical protein
METREYIELIITFLAAFLGSSGLWAYLTKRSDTNDMRNKLLLGLAHDRILALGQHYMNRKWISQDEYENLADYLYKPYTEMGGNGTAKRVMAEVDKLPIRPNRIRSKEVETDE